MTGDEMRMLRETHDVVIRLDERMEDWGRRLEKVELAVFGDGTDEAPGAQKDVAEMKGKWRFWNRVGWLVAGAAAGPAAAGATAVALWLLREAK